jgi:hypothetical protein
MARRLVFSLALLVIAMPALAQKVYVDYDKDADYDSFKTFSWAPTSDTSLEKVSPFMHSRIVNEIEFYMTEGGLIEDNDNPDLFVTYHTNSKDEVRVDTSNYGYGYGGGYYRNPYWGGYGGSMGSSTTTVSNYTRGTLIVDIWDAESKTLVWRGAAEAVVKEKPEAQSKQIDKMLAKMVKKWKSTKRKEGL